MKTPLIVNIQKYSLHDGDGIRTTVFFKGCMLKCLWCHNPESQSYGRELMFNRQQCNGCGYCSRHCPQDAITVIADPAADPVTDVAADVAAGNTPATAKGATAITDPDRCTLCSTCLDYCPHNNREIVGTAYTIDELMDIIDRDARFYEDSGGGVTLSGGEVMTQDMDYLEVLCRRIKQQGYHLNIDTCGFAPTAHFERLLPFTDCFLYDLKTLDDDIHIRYMGQSNRLILTNLEFLADHHATINIRIPVVEPVNSHPEMIQAIITYLKERIGIVKVNLLPYHNTGSSKYAKLGRDYPADTLRTPSPKHMDFLQAMFEAQGFHQVKQGG